MALQLQKVLISDSVDVSCREILESAGISVDSRPGLGKGDLLSIIKDYDGLVVRSATKVTAEVIQAGVRLKLIGRAGTGVDNIDLDAATRNGVIVMNTPGGNTISAAEHTCALMCALARNIPQGCASMKAGKWERKNFMGIELEGKTLGIVGLGRIGREVACRMQSFGMKTVGYDPLVPAEVAATFNVQFMELADLWPVVDFITVHTPLIPQTRGLINDTVFASCKAGVRVVNVARGGIIDEEALLRALESGQCGGAGLDVFTQEPPQNRALVEHPKAVCTPHLGASTVEAQLKVAREVAQQFVAAVKGEGLMGVVNVPRLTNAMTPSNAPWVQLATRLTKLACASASPTNILLTLCGEKLPPAINNGVGELLTSAVLVGTSAASNINLINAKTVAGTKVTMNSEPGGCDSIKVGHGEVCLTGTVLDTLPVLVGVNGSECGMMTLRGNLIMTKGRTIGDIAQTLQGVTEINVCGDYVVAKVTTLPSDPVHGSVAAVTL